MLIRQFTEHEGLPTERRGFPMSLEQLQAIAATRRMTILSHAFKLTRHGGVYTGGLAIFPIMLRPHFAKLQHTVAIDDPTSLNPELRLPPQRTVVERLTVYIPEKRGLHSNRRPPVAPVIAPAADHQPPPPPQLNTDCQPVLIPPDDDCDRENPNEEEQLNENEYETPPGGWFA